MEIEVEGLGIVEIEGDEPSEVERQAILKALGRTPAELDPNAPVEGVSRFGEKNLPQNQEFGTLSEDTTPLVTQLTGGVVTRPFAEAAGATGGAALGSTSGPAGTLAGAGLGAGAGSAAFDTADVLARKVAGLPPTPDTTLGPTLRALNATKDELTFTGGAMALVPLVRSLKPLIGVKPDESILGKVLGVTTPEAKRIAELSRSQDIPLGAIQTTENKIVKGSSRVLGIFPIVGTPIKKGAEAVSRGITRKFDDILNTVAPNATIAELGVDLTQAAKAKFGKFGTVAGVLYNRFFALADNASVRTIIPTEAIRKSATEIGEEVTSATVQLSGGRTSKPAVDERVLDFLDEVREFPERISARQARGLQERISDIAAEMEGEGRNLVKVIQVKAALEADFHNPLVDQLAPEEGRKIISALATANGFYAETIKRFQSSTGRRFERVDKNIFKSGPFKAGTLNEDEAFQAVFISRSPRAVADLKSIVGQKRFRQATRKFLDSSFKSSLTAIKGRGGLEFNPNKFSDLIGVGEKEGRQALNVMLSGTGVTGRELENFAEVARKAGSIFIPDTSVFLARRFTLGGLKAIMGGVVIGGSGLTTSPIGTAVGVLMIRHGAKILSDPQRLQALTRALEDTTSSQQARALVLRVGRQVIEADDSVLDVTLDEVNQSQ